METCNIQKNIFTLENFDSYPFWAYKIAFD